MEDKPRLGATGKDIAENWDLINNPAQKWYRLTADEQKMIIHSTRYPGANGHD